MNALAASNATRQTHQPDKENIPPGGYVKPPGGGGKQAKKPKKKQALCPNCKCFALHKPKLCYELEANKAKRYPGWKSIFEAAPSTWQGPGTTIDVEPVAAKIVQFPATHTKNYWSPLACLVEEQEEISESNDKNTSLDWAMNATTDIGPTNTVAAHWARKINNRKLRKMGILDTGATYGAAPEEDEECFVDTGKASTKTFMFPDKRTNKATKSMLTKHNLRPAARKMNIVPGLHSTLISVPKLADAGYTTVFSKAGAMIYDDYTTKNLGIQPPRPRRRQM
jgi:hypothetical protein